MLMLALCLAEVPGLSPRASALAAEPSTVWWDAAWPYRKAVTVNAPGSPGTGLPSGYSVKLVVDHAALVATGKSLPSGDDVRVVYWNGSAHVELDRVLERGSAWNSSTTALWFNTRAALAAGGADDNFTVYYGNAGASAGPANADNVWLLWDDFQAGALNTAKWSAYSSAGFVMPSVAGGQLQISMPFQYATQIFTVGVRSTASLPVDVLVESSFSIVSQSPSQQDTWTGSFGLGRECSVGLAIGSSSGGSKRVGCWNGAPPWWSWQDIASSGLNGPTFTEQRLAQAVLGDGTGQHYENGILKATVAGLGTGARLLDLGFSPGTASSYVAFDVRFDDVRVRRFVGSEAAVSAAGEVQPSPVPTLGAVSPVSAPAGSPGLTLAVTGSNFVSASVVRWNGANRATTVVSGTQLQATILASDLVNPGTAQVTVFTPAPGGGVSSPRAFTITSTATRLAVTSVNGGASPAAGTGFPVIVTAQNAAGQAATVGSATSVSLSLKTGTGTLGGTLTGTIVAGASQVTLAGVTYAKAEGGVVLTATRTSGEILTAGDSVPFTVNPGAASALVFTTQPGNASAGSAIPGPPTVTVRDASGNTVTTSTVSITVAIGTNPGGGALSGVTTRSATSGVVSFSGLSIDAAATGYTLTAGAGGLTGAASAGFSVSVSTGPGVTGMISRAGDARAIGGAVVEALQGVTVKGADVTGTDGSYSMTGLTAGTYLVRASADGYQTAAQAGVSVPATGSVTVNLGLAPAPSSSSVSYVHDRLGRLKAVIDPTGEAATYAYDAVGNLLSIGRQSSTLVSVIDFSPGGGPAGVSVRIAGTGFSGTASQNTVRFNGVTGAVSSSTTTEIVATVPAGATTGPIAVTAPSGSATSATSFTVGGSPISPPTISGFTPSIAPAGAAVIINGANFDTVPANNRTRVNTTPGSPSTATPTAIGITVPSSTGSGRVSVTTEGGIAVSTADLFIPPPPYAAASVDATARMGIGDGAARTVTISAAGKVALVVFDGVTGQRLSLQMTGVTIPSSTVTIYTPTGASMASVPVSTSGASTAILTLPATGTYTILVAPVSSGTGSMTLRVGAPDLVVPGLTGPSATVVANPDGTWTFVPSWTVRNVGSAGTLTTATWWDRVYLSSTAAGTTSDVQIAQRQQTGGLAAGASYTVSWPATVPSTVAPGTYWLRVVSDQGNDVAESDETNNAGVSATPVTLALAPPDLTVTSVAGPTAAVLPGVADGTWRFTVSWTVRNAAATAAPVPASWKDRIYIASAQSGGAEIQVGELAHTGGLAGGASYSASLAVTVPATWPWGFYWLRVVTDAAQELSESSDGNNVGVSSAQVTLAPKPDLVVADVSGPTTPVTPAPDGRWLFTVSGTVQNAGQGPAPSSPSWVDRVYLSAQQTGTPTGPQIAEAVHTGGLAATASYKGTVSAIVPATVPAGPYWIVARADATQQIAETNESNNQGVSASQVTLIARPDLVVVGGTWPSAPVTRNPDGSWTFQIAATIQNIGPSPASAPVVWMDRAYLSTGQSWPPTGPTIAEAPRNGGLAAGATYSVGGTAVVPATVLPGQYWILVKTDDAGQLVEENEGNNVAVSLTQITLSP